MTIGAKIREARAQAGFADEEQFAEKMGITEATLGAWEANIETPSDEQLQRLVEATGADPAALSHLTGAAAPKGICSPVDLVPSPAQAEVLEQVGLSPDLWRDADRWVAFLRLTRAAGRLSPEELSRLAKRAEVCVRDQPKRI